VVWSIVIGCFYIALGIIFVDVVGYLWHRFVKHEGLLGQALVRGHYDHHEKHYPVGALRSYGQYKDADVLSWNLFSAVCLLFLYLLLPMEVFLFVSGGAIGYATLIVAWFHRIYHRTAHWTHRYNWMRTLMNRHDLHHWMNCNYSIAFFWMDRLFGTLVTRSPASLYKEDLFKEKNEI